MENICYKLHNLFNSLKRYNFDTIDDIPFNNGIYIFLEKNEYYKYFDRIVRVGTDTAILNKEKDFKLLNYWNLDLTKRIDKDKNFDIKLNEKCKLLEKRISEYMQNNFSFVVFNVETKEERLRLESAIISALNKSNDFFASPDWLGNFIPDIKGNHIKDCRMWLSQGLKANPITEEEFLYLQKICDVNK